MSRAVLFAVLVTASACDRGRLDTLERRVETLEKKDTEKSTASTPADGALATLTQDVADAKAGKAASEQKIAELQQQLAELQQQYNDMQKQLADAGPVAVAAAAESTTGVVGIKACDEYIEKYTRCIAEKVPVAARKSMNEAMDASVKAWREAAAGPAREALGTACKAALEAARTATAAMGCEW